MTCPDSFRSLVFASISYDWPHPAAVSLHCPVHIMVLVLTCPELPPLPCPIICLFWPRSAVVAVVVLAQICSCWFFFGVCPGLPCLVPFSAHTFPCSVWLCMPCPELLAQDAAVHHRKLPVLALSCLSSKSQPFHSEPHKLLDSSQWSGYFSGFFSGRKKSVRLVI